MGLLKRHRWFLAAAGIILVFAVVCLTGHRSPALTLFSDLTGLLLMLAGIGVMAANAVTRPRQERSFWVLMVLGFALWAVNQTAWTIWETILYRPIPDPFVFDIVLFFRAVPLFAAVAWRPDLKNREGNVLLGVLNFLMLMGWWIFLYAFIVFPHQYVILNTPVYNAHYDRLYGVENGLLLAILIFAAWTSRAGWRRLYLHYLGALAVYAINSQFLDHATPNQSYYSGSLYDIPLIATIAWVVAVSLSARKWELTTVPFEIHPRWRKLISQTAMLAILSLPVLGLWTILLDNSPAPSRAFRIFAVLTAMLLLGGFAFICQYFQDQTLIALLRDSRRAYDSQKQLQSQLVQKEKLASLSTMVAGAAHEINHPLTAILSCSEELWAQQGLSEEQTGLLRKIVNQARRTGDLVSNLLSFAQQAPGEKTLVDLGVLLNRATQMLETRRSTGKIHTRVSLEPDVPRVLANANQMFQVFIEIIENAMDALDESGGGSLEITVRREGAEMILQFSDSGPGLRDPQRVFDPFYTTKPIGKGTGLGLSAVYGVIQDHGGQITCRNKPEGGALFTITLPASTAPAVQSAGASA